MDNLLAIIAVGLIVLYFLGPRVQTQLLTQVTTSSMSPTLPEGISPTAIGVASELVRADLTKQLLAYGVDPTYRMAFPMRPEYWHGLRVVPLTDPQLVAISVQMNPELANAAGKFQLPMGALGVM